ncbi:hypothetical protein BU17DRAFT_82967 [Hysterangium stoloniferum]|nr:hypothetical protein BU17DRAFT_82967 [Hysterangium stoloniferum]
MSSACGKNTWPRSVRGQGLPPAIPRVVDTSSGGAGSSSLPVGSGLANVEEAPVAETFNSVESLFNAMRDAIVRANGEKGDRNKVQASLRAEGRSDMDADEALEAMPSEGALCSVVTPTAGNRGMSIETGQDPPERGVGSGTLVSDMQDAGPQNVSEQVSKGDVGRFHPTLPIPAGITTPLMAAINNKYRTVDYSKAPPIYDFDEIRHNKLELDLASISNQILHMAFKKRVCGNVDLKYSRISVGYGASKYFLDTACFPSEALLTAVDFLQAYANWLSIIRDTCGEGPATQGWYKHCDKMQADPDFAMWFLTWFEMDKALHIQWNSTSPTVPDPSDMFYILSLKWQHACQGLPAQPGDSLQVVLHNVHAALPAPAAWSSDTTLSDHSCHTLGSAYHPYHSDSFWAPAPTAKDPMGSCICCGVHNSHFAHFFHATRSSHPDQPIIAEWWGG